jgi:modification methylase
MTGAPCTATVFHGDSRRMDDVPPQSVALVVTSPPYWQIKDYGAPGQIGHGQGLHAYLYDLFRVWKECFRVIAPGGRLCVNVGDQFARARLYGRYRVIPLHAEIIGQCASLGFDYLGAIVWRKKTTMNTSGGATVMGSYPYPPNGIVEIDFEYILLFKKPGAGRKATAEMKRGAAMSRDEWKSWFSGHWEVGGARKNGHDAPFPEEIPRRLIRMFSFPDDTVLDPFLGTGTTAAVAVELERNAIGYEINERYLHMAMDRIGPLFSARMKEAHMAETELGREPPAAESSWRPHVPDLALAEGAEEPVETPPLHSVTAVEEDCSLRLDTGERVTFAGLRIERPDAALAYLRQRVLRKKVFLLHAHGEGGAVRARVLLKNRICINAQLLKMGAASETAEQE